MRDQRGVAIERGPEGSVDSAWALIALALMPTKVCSRCRLDLPVVMFNAASDAPDGRQAYCCHCQSKVHADWRARRRAPGGTP
jgi:hypothetical protein